MVPKQNCWEFKTCGREPGGKNEKEYGVCPAVEDESGNGYNHGKNGGRICWAVAGTFCGGKMQGTFAQKRANCMSCDFFKLVKEEEGTANFKLMKQGQVYKAPV